MGSNFEVQITSFLQCMSHYSSSSQYPWCWISMSLFLGAWEDRRESFLSCLILGKSHIDWAKSKFLLFYVSAAEHPTYGALAWSVGLSSPPAAYTRFTYRTLSLESWEDWTRIWYRRIATEDRWWFSWRCRKPSWTKPISRSCPLCSTPPRWALGRCYIVRQHCWWFKHRSCWWPKTWA